MHRPSFIRRASPADLPALIAADAHAQAHASRRAFLESAVARDECLVAAAADGGGVQGFVVLTHGRCDRSNLEPIGQSNDLSSRA